MKSWAVVPCFAIAAPFIALGFLAGVIWFGLTSGFLLHEEWIDGLVKARKSGASNTLKTEDQ